MASMGPCLGAKIDLVILYVSNGTDAIFLIHTHLIRETLRTLSINLPSKHYIRHLYADISIRL